MMKKNLVFWLSLLLFTLATLQPCMAEDTIVVPTADFYSGDSSVYNGSATGAPPNIMFLFDVSENMTRAGSALEYTTGAEIIAQYEALTDADGDHYISKYDRDQVYVQLVVGSANDAKMNVDDGGDGDYVSYEPARAALIENGKWIGSLKKGALDDGKDMTYFTGDMACLMFELSNVPLAPWENGHTYYVGDVIEGSYVGDVNYDAGTYKFACIQAGTSHATDEPTWNPGSVAITDGSVKWQPAKSALAVAASVLKQVANELRGKVNLGVAIIDELNIGARIDQPLINTTTDTDLETFEGKMDDLASFEISGNHQQVDEALWDVGTYYNGDTSVAFSSRTKGVVFPPAAEYWCQSNNVILVTTGMDSISAKTPGVVDDPVKFATDGFTVDPDGSTLDVAKHLYDNLAPSYLDTEGHAFHVKTHVIELFSKLQKLEDTAFYGGNGLYYSLSNAEELEAIMANLILGLLEADSSFVAPVVPASPDNRAYSGDKIFLGFFKPMVDEPWYGNLKKFGLGMDSQIKGFDSLSTEDTETDKLINATDAYGYFLHDGTDNKNPTVRSYWKSEMDGGEVHLGGVGKQLLTQASRTIYTSDGSDLVTFDTTNITATLLGVADDTERDDLINFIQGYESDGTTKRPWMLGDIIHSKPVVLHYNVDDTSTTDVVETQSYIFVGANDGMLHAFDNSTGEEEWGFIPQDLLKNLRYIPDTNYHTYFVDNSPVIYHNDSNDDALVDKADGDEAVLICGMRRGGGTSTISDTSMGSYFALDISDPANPSFMWQLNSTMTNAGEMGQTWSLPRLTKIRTTDGTKVVAIFGAGYDTNEDLRFGPNLEFPDTTDATTITSQAENGADFTISAGGRAATSTDHLALARGRGVYVVDVETGDILWKYTYAENLDSMTFAMPSDPLVIDRDRDGYADHIYIGDTGGQLWRFNIENPLPPDSPLSTAWTATCIFTSNPGDGDTTDVGRKIFYKPTATIRGDDTFIYFGTGDREHPLNTAVVDRFYVIRDRENETPPVSPLTEANLVDVTNNELQNDPDTAKTNKTLEKLTGTYTVGETTYYGWHIKLTAVLDDTIKGVVDKERGEKALALAKVFNNVLYFTTYTPAIIDSSDSDYDPCEGVLGPSRVYAVNAQTGEAVFNFYTLNDTDEDGDGEVDEVLKRADRHLAVGDGIASEPLIIVGKSGDTSVMVGRGGGFFNSGAIENVDPAFPVYWMKW